MELIIEGYLTLDHNGIYCVQKDKKSQECKKHSIIKKIEDFAKEYGMFGEIKTGLGGTKSIVENCNLRIYFSNKKCSLTQAMKALDILMYGGDLKTRVENEGYSEYTITGMCLEDFSIGGHSLNYELNTNLDKYIHIIIST